MGVGARGWVSGLVCGYVWTCACVCVRGLCVACGCVRVWVSVGSSYFVFSSFLAVFLAPCLIVYFLSRS